MIKVLNVILILSLAFTPTLSIADMANGDTWDQENSKFFSTGLVGRPPERRNFGWSPLASIFLPGFDQWWEGQYSSAAAYTGYALLGLNVAHSAYDDPKDYDDDQTETRNNRDRQYQLGTQMYMISGFVSAYHSFRSAVRSQQAHERFLFLTREETTDQLMLAPFAFEELKKPTTFVPLIIAAGLGAVTIRDKSGTPHFTLSDGFYSAATSCHAGVGEEALFRGYLMPVAQEYFGNRFWSNTATALLFAAGHLGRTDTPWPQFLLGWYFGYLTQRNEWTLRQSIFIHAWWDAIIFASVYYANSKRPDSASSTRALSIPLFTGSF